jgi:hypothetical protein
MPIMSCRLKETHDTLHTTANINRISKIELQYNVLFGIMIFWREVLGIYYRCRYAAVSI